MVFPKWVRTDTRYIGMAMHLMLEKELEEVGSIMGWLGVNSEIRKFCFWEKSWWIVPFRSWASLPDTLIYWSVFDAEEWIRVQEEEKISVDLSEWKRIILERKQNENPGFYVFNLPIRINIRGGNRTGNDRNGGWPGIQNPHEFSDNISQIKSSILPNRSEISWNSLTNFPPMLDFEELQKTDRIRIQFEEKNTSIFYLKNRLDK